jgi:hypothetical protein
MFWFLVSFAYLWVYEGDSLYKGLSKGSVITSDSIILGNKIEEFDWESSGFISEIVKVEEDIYFSVSDEGIVAKLNKNGKIDTVLERKGSLISLGKKGNVLAAGLSPSGKIFFIKDSGILDSLSAPFDNIYCMFEFNGNFLVGTGPEGKIYKLINDKEFKDYYKTQSTSVTDWVIKDGELFLGTSNPGLVYKVDQNNTGEIYYDPGFEEINGLGYVGDTLCVSGFSFIEGESIGGIKFYLKDKEFEVYKGTIILCGEETNGKFYAGEGEDGQIGEFHKNNFSIVADIDESKVTTLKNIDRDLWMGSGYPAKIYKFTNDKLESGEYISSVFKGGVSAIWGNLEYEGEGNIDIFIRGGKKKEVDSSWSEWKKIGRKITIEEPFFQWKALLKEDNAYLKKVRVSYGKENSFPEIKKVGVLPPRIGTGQADENGAIMGSIPPEEKERLKRMGFYIPEDAYMIPEGVRAIYWEAADPDNDRLLFDIFVSRDSKSWDKIKDNLRSNSYSLNISAYPDGTYYIKIIARDDLDRTDPLKSEKTTSFLVDQTPPVVKGIEKKKIGDSVIVSGTVTDDLSSIISVLYSTAETKNLQWKRARAVDDLFDEKKEDFVFKVHSKEKYGAIRVVDRSSNSKVVRIEF